MNLDREAATPLYRQTANWLLRAMRDGTYAPGARLPTEKELCVLLGVSRYPLRQALDMLAEDGLIERIPGRGTFVSQILDKNRILSEQSLNEQKQKTGNHLLPGTDIPPFRDNRPLALLVMDLSGDYTRDIARGFIQAAASCGRAALVAISSDDAEENQAIDRVLAAGAAGLVIFPRSGRISGRLKELRRSGLHCSLIDRHIGLADFDFIETDNVGGGFMAARHMYHHGYRAAVFAGDNLSISSVQERLLGFRQGMAQYGIRWLNLLGSGQEERRPQDPADDLPCSCQSLLDRLDLYMDYRPFAVFCENDASALALMDRLRERGMNMGTEIGVIGFDNESAGRYHQPPLTTVAQNGWLIGETAARLMADALTNPRQAIVRHVLPTQIVIRRSCGEVPGQAGKDPWP